MGTDRLSVGHHTVISTDPLDEGDGGPCATAVSDQDTTDVNHIASRFAIEDGSPIIQYLARILTDQSKGL